MKCAFIRLLVSTQLSEELLDLMVGLSKVEEQGAGQDVTPSFQRGGIRVRVRGPPLIQGPHLPADLLKNLLESSEVGSELL